MIERIAGWVVNKLIEKYGLQVEVPILEPEWGGHGNGTPHVIEAIGRSPKGAVYFCLCGERLLFESRKVMVPAEGGEGWIDKIDYNPFRNPKALPAGWVCGEELRQLDTDSL